MAMITTCPKCGETWYTPTIELAMLDYLHHLVKKHWEALVQLHDAIVREEGEDNHGG